jgi:hypothetical protein
MHEALHGHPQDYIGPPGGMTKTSRDRIRKYRVGELSPTYVQPAKLPAVADALAHRARWWR